MKTFAYGFGTLLMVLFVCCAFSPAFGKDKEKAKITLPDAADKAVKAEFPKAEIKDVGMETVDNVSVYEVELKNNGKGMSILVTAEGLIVSVEAVIEMSEAPAAVEKAIKDAAGDAKIGTVEKSETRATVKDGKFVKLDAVKITYEAELKKDGKTADVEVAEDGTVLEQPKWPEKKKEDKKEDKKGKKDEKEDEENEGGEEGDGD